MYTEWIITKLQHIQWIWQSVWTVGSRHGPRSRPPWSIRQMEAERRSGRSISRVMASDPARSNGPYETWINCVVEMTIKLKYTSNTGLLCRLPARPLLSHPVTVSLKWSDWAAALSDSRNYSTEWAAGYPHQGYSSESLNLSHTHTHTKGKHLNAAGSFQSCNHFPILIWLLQCGAVALCSILTVEGKLELHHLHAYQPGICGCGCFPVVFSTRRKLCSHCR